MSTQKRSRLDWLVASRGYAMYGIFLGHILTSLGFDHGHHAHDHPLLHFIGRYLDPMLIPFFVLIIGAFYSRTGSGFADYAKLKFGQRMLPVYLYLLLVIPFYFIFPVGGGSGWDSVARIPMYLLGIPWLNWPSWFLIALFVAEILHYFIQPRFKKPRQVLLLALTLFTLGWLFNYYKFEHPTLFFLGMIWMIHACPLFLSLLLLGSLLKKQLIKMTQWPVHKVLLLGIAATSILVLAVELNTYPMLPKEHGLHNFVPNDRIANMFGQYGQYLWFLLAVIAGPIAFTCFCRLAPVNRFIRSCGDYSLVLLGLNGIFLNVLNVRLVGLFSHTTESDALLLAYCMLLAFASLAACLGLAMVLDKYLPQLCGKPMLKGPILPALYNKPKTKKATA